MLSFTIGKADEVGVAVETPSGPVVESLLEHDFAVHSINPKELDRFRDRLSPAGAKDDRRDARVLASALRTDPHCLRRLKPTDPAIVELREWSRLGEEPRRGWSGVHGIGGGYALGYAPDDDTGGTGAASECPVTWKM